MTQTTVTQLEDWLMRPEGTTLEFKDAFKELKTMDISNLLQELTRLSLFEVFW